MNVRNRFDPIELLSGTPTLLRSINPSQFISALVDNDNGAIINFLSRRAQEQVGGLFPGAGVGGVIVYCLLFLVSC